MFAIALLALLVIAAVIVLLVKVDRDVKAPRPAVYATPVTFSAPAQQQFDAWESDDERENRFHTWGVTR